MIFWIGAGLFVTAGGIGGQWWYQRAKRRCRLLTALREILIRADDYIKNVGGEKAAFWETIEEKALFGEVSQVRRLELNEKAASLLSSAELAAFAEIDNAFCAQCAESAERILQKAIALFPQECSYLLKKANAQRAVVFCASVLLVLLLF